MNRLIQQLQRLYFLDDQFGSCQQFEDDNEGILTPELLARSLAGETTIALDPVDAARMARLMVVGFEKSTDWESAAKLYQAIQEDLELPAPAISVSATAGYQLWLSLAERVPFDQVRLFLEALRLKYLTDISSARLRFHPDAGHNLSLVPAFDEVTGKWSAFIDPTMGAMFADEPGLDMAPNLDRQADMLGGLKSIPATDFQRALALLRQPDEAPAQSPEPPAVVAPDCASPARLAAGTHYSDPKSFLLAVMNDASATKEQRIEAAKALLPYCHDVGPAADRDTP